MAEDNSEEYFAAFGMRLFSGPIIGVAERVASLIKGKKQAYVCVTGAHGVVESTRKQQVLQAHQDACLVVPDGMPLVWLSKLLGHTNTERIYGPDLFLALCERAEKEKWRVFLYGTTDGTLQKLKERLLVKFPELLIVGSVAPPFRPLTFEEEKTAVTKINNSKAEIVFIGLSTPKQELWMQKHSPKLKTRVLVGVGAAFDFLAGVKRQAPVWMRSAGLEWLFRFMQEPRRLWYRSIVLNGIFIGIMLKTLTGAYNRRKFITYISPYIFSLALFIFLLGVTEVLAHVVTNKGWASYYKPMEIQTIKNIGKEKEDWRLTHMMEDEYFTPDPLLLWKPKSGKWRFNEDGYVGKVMRSDAEKARSDGGCVIMALGDSNTQGIETTSWPEEMNAIFEERGYKSRVINAGVAGYTSYQGVIKFISDLKAISPTHVFISFGWNDAAPSMGSPDSTFIKSHSRGTSILYKLRLYLIFQAMFAKQQTMDHYVPRVSLGEYEHNLLAMIKEAKANGVKVTLVTRPYNPTDYLYWKTLPPDQGGWRTFIDGYNNVVRRVAREQSVGLWDMNQLTALRAESFTDDSHYSAETYKEMAITALQQANIRTRCK